MNVSLWWKPISRSWSWQYFNVLGDGAGTCSPGKWLQDQAWVQDAFGQCSHSHGMTPGVSSAESGVGLFMILVGQSIFQLGISCDAVIMTVMKNLGKLKRRLWRFEEKKIPNQPSKLKYIKQTLLPGYREIPWVWRAVPETTLPPY